MGHRLYVAGVMPSKIFVLLDQGSHGRDPCLSLEALESFLQGLFNFWKSFVVTLQGIAAGTYRIFNIAELGAGDAAAGRCIVARAGHLGGIRQAAGYFFCFFYFHLNFFGFFILKQSESLRSGPRLSINRSHLST